MNKLNSGTGKVKVVAVVRDKHGRVVVEDHIFKDKDKLDQLRQAVIKNGSYA